MHELSRGLSDLVSRLILLILGLAICIIISLEIGEVRSESVNNLLISPKEEIGAPHGKILDGWKMAGKGNFTVTDDSALRTGGQGILWHTEKEFDNFVLKLDWKVSDKGDNSGVFVRFPNLDNDPKIAVKEGYQIQIDDGAGNPLHHTGANYDIAAPTKLVSKPPGQWNNMQIMAFNQSYKVFINGEKINGFVGDRQLSGYIGLQSHDDKSTIFFRNIQIREVPR